MNDKGVTPMKANSKTPAQRKAETKRIREKMRRDDATFQKKQAQSYRELAASLPALVEKFPRIEWEIVHNYMRRNNRVMVDRE